MLLSVIFGFFFFKQKTAYEMRISDWSSDVCSSDLRQQGGPVDALEELPAAGAELAHQAGVEIPDQLADRGVQLGQREEPAVPQPRQDPEHDDQHRRLRQEESRVGKECVSQCRTRWLS